MTEFLKFLGQLAAAIAVLLPLLIWLIKKWIESEFSKNFEDYKHQINKDLEDYRHKINSLFSRVTKIHEKEFEVLPEAWRLLQIARGLMGEITEAIQRGHPDFGRMNADQIREYINRLPECMRLQESDQETLFNLGPEDRDNFYNERYFWLRLNVANDAMIAFHNYIIENKIFLTQDLCAQFENADNIIRRNLITREIDNKTQEFSFDKYQERRAQLENVCTEIENLVQQRLHHEDAI